MKNSRIPKIIFFIFVACLLSGCISPKGIESDSITFSATDFIPQEFTWQAAAPAIDYFYFENPDIPLVYHVVKVDLTNPLLQIVCYPDGSTKFANDGAFTGMTTAAFAKKYDCALAINASPFQGHLLKKKITGIHLADDKLISKSNPKYSAIAFIKEDGYRAQIIQKQSDQLPAGTTFAFGGFFTVLKDGQVQYSFANIYDTRSGAGLSQDGKTLYLLVVEAERHSRSIGLTYPKCGEIFKALGCSDALELDGGGSTNLCLNGKSILNYRPLRIVANSFGFKIKEEK